MHQKHFKNGWWEDAYPSSHPPKSVPRHKLQKPSKESGIFQSLDIINFFFTKRKSQRGHGTMPPPKYAPGHHVRRCPIFRVKSSKEKKGHHVRRCPIKHNYMGWYIRNPQIHYLFAAPLTVLREPQGDRGPQFENH